MVMSPKRRFPYGTLLRWVEAHLADYPRDPTSTTKDYIEQMVMPAVHAAGIPAVFSSIATAVRTVERQAARKEKYRARKAAGGNSFAHPLEPAGFRAKIDAALAALVELERGYGEIEKAWDEIGRRLGKGGRS